MQNEFVNVHLSHPKPRGKELTEPQKQENREFSRQRVVCEQAHAGMKRDDSVSVVRGIGGLISMIRLMLVAAGLWNLYWDVA